MLPAFIIYKIILFTDDLRKFYLIPFSPIVRRLIKKELKLRMYKANHAKMLEENIPYVSSNFEVVMFGIKWSKKNYKRQIKEYERMNELFKNLFSPETEAYFKDYCINN